MPLRRLPGPPPGRGQPKHAKDRSAVRSEPRHRDGSADGCRRCPAGRELARLHDVAWSGTSCASHMLFVPPLTVASVVDEGSCRREGIFDEAGDRARAPENQAAGEAAQKFCQGMDMRSVRRVGWPKDPRRHGEALEECVSFSFGPLRLYSTLIVPS